MLALITLLLLNQPVHAQTIENFQGTYNCQVEGQPRLVGFEVRDEHLFVHGLDVGLNNALACTNHTLSKAQNGAIYTFVSSCDGSHVYRALSLQRPEALEEFSMATDVEQITANEIHVQVQIKFTGAADRDVSIVCLK